MLIRQIHFAHESCALLSSIADNSMDLIVSNFVLMDLEDYETCLHHFYRVLRKGGKVSLVMLHPCFETTIDRSEDLSTISFRWNTSYLDSVMVKVTMATHFLTIVSSLATNESEYGWIS